MSKCQKSSCVQRAFSVLRRKAFSIFEITRHAIWGRKKDNQSRAFSKKNPGNSNLD